MLDDPHDGRRQGFPFDPDSPYLSCFHRRVASDRDSATINTRRSARFRQERTLGAGPRRQVDGAARPARTQRRLPPGLGADDALPHGRASASRSVTCPWSWISTAIKALTELAQLRRELYHQATDKPHKDVPKGTRWRLLKVF
jgi:hypothetical protein